MPRAVHGMAWITWCRPLCRPLCRTPCEHAGARTRTRCVSECAGASRVRECVVPSGRTVGRSASAAAAALVLNSCAIECARERLAGVDGARCDRSVSRLMVWLVGFFFCFCFFVPCVCGYGDSDVCPMRCTSVGVRCSTDGSCGSTTETETTRPGARAPGKTNRANENDDGDDDVDGQRHDKRPVAPF